MKNYRWGIIGLGRIASEFCRMFPQDQTLYGAATASDPKRAAEFAQAHHILHSYPSYQALVADPNIDIVYVATTHNFHYENIKLALNAGKHVFAEKSVTVNSKQLAELTALAESRHLILMEAQTIYHMPLYDQLDKLIPKLGQLKTVSASLGLHVDQSHPEDRLLNPNLAGGALLDMGIYALSFIRRFMTAKPELVASQMRPAFTGVDDASTFLLTNKNGEQATATMNLLAATPQIGTAVFQEGFITIDGYLRPEKASFYDAKTGKTSIISAGENSKAMTYEAEAMVKAIETGQNPTWQWTQDTMAIMTAARKAWGFTYPGETL